jgi:hypothetical protein
MRGDPPAEIPYLLAYYRGIHFATVALKARLGKLEHDCEEGVQMVGDYQAMVKGYSDALKETVAMHRERQSHVKLQEEAP